MMSRRSKTYRKRGWLTVRSAFAGLLAQLWSDRPAGGDHLLEHGSNEDAHGLNAAATEQRPRAGHTRVLDKHDSMHASKVYCIYKHSMRAHVVCLQQHVTASSYATVVCFGTTHADAIE
jgi:hypothetical protein